ncbi:MAG: hypothetical protein AB2L14_28585 [Candidatus Xenobiia bacterium LiM19]
MKNYRYMILISMLAACCLIASCSGGTGGIAPDDSTNPAGALTSQMEVTVDKAAESEFTSDLGYAITVSNAMIVMSDITVGAGAAEEDEHGKNAAELSSCSLSRHEETSTESGDMGATLEGQWTVYPYSGKTLLGVAQANPGTYGSLSFSVVPVGHIHSSIIASDEHNRDEEEVHSVLCEGTVVTGEAVLPFHAHFHLDDTITVSGLDIIFEYGHYLPLHIIFPIQHWLDGIDFNTLTVQEGVIHISEHENSGAYEIMKNTILSHVHVHPGYETGLLPSRYNPASGMNSIMDCLRLRPEPVIALSLSQFLNSGVIP